MTRTNENLRNLIAEQARLLDQYRTDPATGAYTATWYDLEGDWSQECEFFRLTPPNSAADLRRAVQELKRMGVTVVRQEIVLRVYPVGRTESVLRDYEIKFERMG